jgi:hypothetical protein
MIGIRIDSVSSSATDCARRFYGSLRNNCTTAILAHVNGIGDTRIPGG